MTKQKSGSSDNWGVPHPTSTQMEKTPPIMCKSDTQHMTLTQRLALQLQTTPTEASESNRLMCGQKAYYTDKKRRKGVKINTIIVGFHQLSKCHRSLGKIQHKEWHEYCYKLFVYRLCFHNKKFSLLKSKSELCFSSTTEGKKIYNPWGKHRGKKSTPQLVPLVPCISQDPSQEDR